MFSLQLGQLGASCSFSIRAAQRCVAINCTDTTAPGTPESKAFLNTNDVKGLDPCKHHDPTDIIFNFFRLQVRSKSAGLLQWIDQIKVLQPHEPHLWWTDMKYKVHSAAPIGWIQMQKQFFSEGPENVQLGYR